MKKRILIFLCFPLWTNVLAQGNTESLFQIDTLQISPTIKKMVLKYYKNEEGYTHQDEKKMVRFEIFFLGDSIPFQRDTIENMIWGASYEDANFDNILDIKIVDYLGANGGEGAYYYFFNPIFKKYEFGVGGLSNPKVNKEDSTISTEAHCCMGTGGNGETYKFINGKFILIDESEYDREYSYDRKLIGNILITTDTSHTTTIESRDGGQIIVDSTWKYLFGKLRIVDVSKKMASEHLQQDNYQEEGVFSEDVMGAFIFKSEEKFEYSRDIKGRLICSYTLHKAKKKELVLVKQDKWHVKD